MNLLLIYVIGGLINVICMFFKLRKKKNKEILDYKIEHEVNRDGLWNPDFLKSMLCVVAFIISWGGIAFGLYKEKK